MSNEGHPALRRARATVRRVALGRGLLLLAGVLIVVFLVGAWLIIADMRARAFDSASQSLRSLSTAIASEETRSIQATDLGLQNLQQAIGDIISRDHLLIAPDDALRTTQVHDLLVDRLSALSQLDALSVLGPDGRLDSFSRSWPTPSIDLSDRDYYQHFKDIDDNRPFLSAPVQNRSSGTWTFYLGRRLDGPHHEFLGVVLAAFRISDVEAFYRDVAFAPGHSVTLMRDDGTILARYPALAGQYGRQVSPPILRQLDTTLQLPRWLPIGPDGAPRLISSRRLGRYPALIAVSLPRTAVLAHWRVQTPLVVLGTMLRITILILIVWLLSRQFRRLKAQREDLARTNEALRQSEEHLSEKSRILGTTLEQMDQGLLMVDSARRVVVCNRRAMELLDLPESLMSRNPPFEDVLAYQWRHNEFAVTEASLQEFFRRGGILDQRQTYERRRPNGRVIEVRSTPLEGGGVVRTYADITDRRDAEEQIRFRARHDDLTGLVNRGVFRDALERAIDLARKGEHGFAVLCLDLDRFKAVNDTRGHGVGDKLLRQVASRMRGTVREDDTVARMGGDEFAIIQTVVDQPRAAAALGQRLVERLAEPYEIDGQPSLIGTSVGIAIYPMDGEDAETLMRNADTALYSAKLAGRCTHRFFAEAGDGSHQERLQLELAMRTALGREEFSLAYQPIWETEGSEIRGMLGFEALLRWTHPTRGVLAPDAFLELAERSDLIVPIGEWVLQTACAEAGAWAAPVRIAVNLSAAQLRQADLPSRIEAILSRSGIAPPRLELELTEELVFDESVEIQQAMHRLREIGVRLTLDNFGSRHANLTTLRRFAFDKVKIAREVVHILPQDEAAQTIVEATVALSRHRAFEVTAEGVESEEQLQVLTHLGCSQIQGFLTGAPMAPEHAREQLWRQGIAQKGGPRLAAN
jgi:diguanylate cyclase (GGDEF)-like protein